MRVWNRIVTHATAFLVILTPIPTFAWNYTGHRVIASIPYRQLDDQTKRKIAEVLKKHPAYFYCIRPRSRLKSFELLRL